MSDTRRTSGRLPVTPETLERLLTFRNGLKAASYDEALQCLLYVVGGSHERDEFREYSLGVKYRGKLEELRTKLASSKADDQSI